MSDLISRQALCEYALNQKDKSITPNDIMRFPSAQSTMGQVFDGDTINRQAAIDAHYEYCNKHPDAGFPVWSLKILEDLPSAQPERKKGKWIPETEDWRNQIVWVKCSECGFDTSTSYNYCPNCGCRMD